MAGKRSNAEFQQDVEDRLANHDAMLERILGELQTLNARKEDGALAVNSNQKPYLKLQFPRFGGGDPTGWIYQAEQFFEFQHVPEMERVQLASFHLDGIALQWHRWYTKTRGPLTWQEFTTALLGRFGPTDYENPSESLHRLRQLTTVADYIDTFERLSHRVDDLPETFLVGCFVGGLKEEIRLEVKLKKPRHLIDAMGLARLVEEKLTLQLAGYSTQGVVTNSSSSSGLLGSGPQLVGSSTQGVVSNSSSSSGLLGSGPTQRLALPAPNSVRRISAAEARERREKGLCYFCDERYVPGHKCSKPQLFMISDVSEGGEEVNVDEPLEMGKGVIQTEISFLAIHGNILPQTLRLSGKIKTEDVVVLVDGGSTHNFISRELVDKLGLTVDYDVKFEVVVANSDTLVCTGRVHNLMIMFSGYTLTTDFFVLPVAACPIVLGIQWLKTLGPIEIDFQDLTIGFRIDGSSHKLYGLKRTSLEEGKPNQVTKINTKKPYPVFRLADKARLREVDCYVPKPMHFMHKEHVKPMKT